MSKLIVICITVLAGVVAQEFGACTRLGMELEDRYNARVFSEYQARRSRPSLQITPDFDDFGSRKPETGKKWDL